ncbi:diguanylate cyclase [Acidovorax sp. Root275]|uniref:putative bifunctional diguanylate cyclase/phosphodiesterase n=1 Tax=Acidovorax sp. Root275 TaxID=1736508 RepID=UPI00070A1A92|nr:EAL domain-containing protein [Acidovorax sp. Root275]KRD42432.1 diguanylate cyclase [Acidovorax sp. Root275]
MSLRARILWLVLAASLLPVPAILWLLLEIRSVTTAQARERLVARAGIIASDLDDKIAGTGQLLFGLGRVPLLSGNDKAACSDFLADVLKEHPQYTGLLTIRPDGSLFCDSLRSGRQLDLRDRHYFQRALTATKPVMEAVIGRLTGKGVLQVAYPVREADGALRYILLASLDMQAYGSAMVQAQRYERMHLQVWNGDGSVVMDFQRAGGSPLSLQAVERDFMGRPEGGHDLIEGADGVRRVWVRAQLPRSHDAELRLALAVPEDDLQGPVESQFRWALGGLLALAAVVFAAALLLVEFAVRRYATRAIRAIGRMDVGNYAEPIGAPYPPGELGEVARALDRMAASLLRQQQTIAQHTETLERQARVDPLTQLANRYCLSERLDAALVRARDTGRMVGVLVMDLDRFKGVNDSLGHSRGDLLLQEVATRLQACVGDGGIVARLGGDEFVVVLPDLPGVSAVEPMAQQMLQALTLPVETGSTSWLLSTSLGIAMFPRDGESGDVLLRNADVAMYGAKNQGGNRLAFFSQHMTEALTERLHIEAGLRHAIEHGGLRLHYQPIIDARTGRVSSVEALVRWQDPERGLVSPLQFIGIAEETGLIVPLGDWVLREACAQARGWMEAGWGAIPVAVNLSARQFQEPSLDQTVAHALQSTGCPPGLLQIEITESSIMDPVEQALQTMDRLTALGVQLAIDDFGTGYSSLSQLKRFPVRKLKIDRSFVRDLGHDGSGEVLVDAIVALAQKLGLRTVAEGVETEYQAAWLARQGCDEFQGYLFSQPCTPEALEQVLRERNLPPAGGLTPGSAAP